MKTKHILSLTAIVFAIAFASCSKDGATGPQGPAGSNGTNGTNGTNGAPRIGTNGADGNANVISSGWIGNLTWMAQNDATGLVSYAAHIDAPKLDSVALSNADIRVYVSLYPSPDQTIYALPYINIYDNSDFIAAILALNAIQINVSPGFFVPKENFRFRYIIIPSNKTGRFAATAIDWNNYAAVKAYLGLKD